jgi:hypothetical protein
MRRVGDLLPAAAALVGLGDELRLARAMATWDRIVSELVPAASGGTRLVGISEASLLVAADAPIVAQEILLHGDELLGAFAVAAGVRHAREIRIVGPGRRWGIGGRGLAAPAERDARDARVD